MFLAQKEIESLTGYKAVKKQITWLRGNGIPFVLNRYGHPIILQKQIESIFMPVEKKTKRVEPDVAALKQTLGINHVSKTTAN